MLIDQDTILDGTEYEVRRRNEYEVAPGVRVRFKHLTIAVSQQYEAALSEELKSDLPLLKIVAEPVDGCQWPEDDKQFIMPVCSCAVLDFLSMPGAIMNALTKSAGALNLQGEPSEVGQMAPSQPTGSETGEAGAEGGPNT